MPLPLQPDDHSTPANCAACRMSIRQGSQSFHLASLLLPAEIRQPSYAVYAFCRTADDLIDREAGGVEAIRHLGRMLDRIYSGRPAPDFVERGFADVARRYAIPREVPEALIEGLSWDAEGRRYETLSELKAYAVRVAGTVGLMMTLVMGRRDPAVLARAVDLGIAMQLTNIARDIGEDAANERLYLPLGWLRLGGIDPYEWLRQPRSTPTIRTLVERLLDEAETHYVRSASGLSGLPANCRLGIDTARLLYREIGREIQRGVDPVTRRAVTSRARKLRLLATAIAGQAAARPPLDHGPVPQAAYLIEAIAAAPEAERSPPVPAWWDVGARTVRMVDMLNGFAARGVGAQGSLRR